MLATAVHTVEVQQWNMEHVRACSDEKLVAVMEEKFRKKAVMTTPTA